MATNASVQAWSDELAQALARAKAAGASVIRQEASGLQAKLLANLGDDDTAKYIRPHVKVIDNGDGLRVRVFVAGINAAADAHVAVGKKIDPDFDLALAREFGTRHMAAQPFFSSTIRSNAGMIVARIGSAILAALFGSAAEFDVHNAGADVNPTFEPGDEAHSNVNLRLG